MERKDILMLKIDYQLVKRTTPVVFPKNLGFGNYFTDHIFEMDYNEQAGWHNPVIKPLSQMSMHPATMFIHYGQAIFEGLKAFYTGDDKPVIFRPERHFQRLNNSARRMCIPEIKIEDAVCALEELIAIEKEWIPRGEGEALYIRPFVFGVDPVLGVKPANNYKFLIILSPVGAYYPEGFKPIKILIQDDFVRAVRKGLGECKTPANYASSLLGTELAKKAGFTQVLWLDAVELKYIEEVGTMNIFVRFKDEIVTPQLTGGILPGVTRASVIDILKEWNMNVVERRLSLDELFEEYKKGNVLEVFGTGTAAIITVVGLLKYKDHTLMINDGESGEVALRLFDHITKLQRAAVEDTHNWLHYVPVKEEVLV